MLPRLDYVTVSRNCVVHTLDERLVRLARKLGIKVVATNDFHYLTREDAPTQDILSCIGTADLLDNTNRKHMQGTEFYLKTEDEMRAITEWIASLTDAQGNAIGRTVPLHISRFFPRFQMTDRPATDIAQVYHLADIARENLSRVLTGNC